MIKILALLITLNVNIVYSHSSSYNYNVNELPNSLTLGDINDDGVINVQDIILLVNLILNYEYNNLADLNEDNTIDVLDAVQVVNIILQEIVENK